MQSSMNKVFAPGLFQDKVFVVTGGGTGIGRAIALMAAELGAKVAICGRGKEPLESTSKDLERLGAAVYYDTCDIRAYEHVVKFVDIVCQKFGRVDVLVNNAGGQFVIRAEDLTAKGFNAVIRNNLVGTWNFTHAVATRAFIPQKSGRIVNIIAQIRRGFPGMVHTGAARAGVDNLTKTLAVEWGRFGIAVNSVAPGVIKTSGTDKYGDNFLQTVAESTPIQRLGTPEEVAALVLFLSSDVAAGFITGQTYYQDGGQSLWGSFGSKL